MLLSAIDMGGPSIGVELDTHLIGIDVPACGPTRRCRTPGGLPVNGWRDASAAA
jgi:hypothetical protein